MKIAVFETESWEQDAFESLENNHALKLTGEKLSDKNVEAYQDAEILSTFIFSILNRKVLDAFPDLKLIATRSTGVDHIPVDYCRERGIAVANVPEYGDNTVAEHVFGLLLCISHNLVEAVDRTRRGDFSLRGLRGFDLKGKILGVIGTGSIGEYVIRIAHGFNMRVLAFDVQPRKDLAKSLGFAYVDMDELLSRSDIITLHVPANAHTYHLISDDEFQRMKEGVVIINTARGSVVHIEALARALADGKVMAAGLDVLPEEPTIREESELLYSFYREQHNLRTLLAGHVLLRLRNVIITPHNAFYTREAIGRILDTTVENIQGFIRNKPKNIVT
jgi:D-lactate dehydrogenase